MLRKSVLSSLAFADRGGVSPAAARSLRQITSALRKNYLEEALRVVDRAWRCLPDDAEALAPIYARLLAIEGRDHDATLRLLQRVTSPDADIAALTVHALLHLRRGEESRQHLQAALSDHCVLTDGLLAHVAMEIQRHPDTQAAGWIGLGPKLQFVGELASADPYSALELRLDDGPVFIQRIRAMHHGRSTFQFELLQMLPGATLRASCSGLPLLGSGLTFPGDFALDGRAAVTDTGRSIVGWARIGWLPTLAVQLRVEDENGCRHQVKTGGLPRPGLRWPFTVDLRRLRIGGDRLQISALLPDGRWQSLPDTPLLLAKAVRLPGRKPALLGRWHASVIDGGGKVLVGSMTPVAVIIPVYRGRQETLACIGAALATVGKALIVVVDDATDDAVLAAALDELASAGRIILLRNTTNLGFVGSINRAQAHCPDHDVVLLNSDALVFGDWLERLRAAAYSGLKVGTVTPFSNSGTIASYPHAGEKPLSADEAASLHALAASTNANISRDIPVGVGFCLYVRRDCLDAVGDFDAAVFGKGYGEETDFCLRAQRLGWKHRLAADVFVYHAGGRSFGGRRAALLDRSQRLLNLRHPGYDQFIADFIAQDPLNALRRKLDERRLAVCDGPFVLLVTLALTGGVERFVAERCRDIRAQGFVPLVIRPLKPDDARRCELWTDAIDVPNLHYDVPSDLKMLNILLRGLPLKWVEIQHFLHVDARVINMIRALDVPYDVFVHDYAWICPRITLMDGSGRYCGEPAITVCNSCVRRNGSRLGGTISVGALRQRSAAWLKQARRVIAPSLDTASRLKKYFPIDIEVRAHAVPVVSSMPRRSSSLRPSVRVAVIGAIGEHKGYRVLLNCARDANARGLPLEFVVIGYTENDAPLLATGKVVITGRYSEGEASHLLRREKPDIAFLPSVWPETWCYALDEAVAVGLPVVAFDLGAVAERMREKSLGVMLPLGTRPRHINERLLDFAARAVTAGKHNAVTAHEVLDSNDMNKLAADKDILQNDAISASVQVLPLPSGLYLFSVKTAAKMTDRPQGQLRLPAMHVGLGPGVNSDQVEFISGPATDGAWLFAQEDLLVTRVNSAGATLILTSVRGPGGEVLSIKVERLESRSDAAAPILPAAAARAAKSPDGSGKKTKAQAAASPTTNEPLPLKIAAHLRARGDMSFADVPWAGRVAPGLWIESFSIKPLERFEARDIEYKGLTGSGFETPWISDEKMCGTKGMSVPLVGFAVRLKPSPQAAAYDCEYSAYFKSGITIGPLRNGAPCRSTVANDPLEGIQVHICRRMGANKPAAGTRDVQPTRGTGAGPSFGQYRDVSTDAAMAMNGEGKPNHGGAGRHKAESPKSALKRVNRHNRIVNGTVPTNQRPTARRS